NPPYVAVASPLLAESVAQWEPASALFAGTDGLDDIRFLVAHAEDHLAVGGWLVLEIGTDQGQAVQALLYAAGFCEIEIRQDVAGHDRIAIGRADPIRGILSTSGR
ncbi:MAG TPA: hypothetical protein VMM60_12570, partial [Ilumatobacter sp.]|nr:hypothetical protein [Ilumatobacter sp.]